MKNLAIIPARGGSKRIPGKNIKPFCGKPIIAYSIGAAVESQLFDEVMVSTDDDKIADLARRYGAQVPFMRSAENSNDYATTADVLIEVLSDYKLAGKEFEYGCCLYPTAPFTTPKKLQDSFKVLCQEYADRLIPVVKFDFPVQRALRIVKGRVIYVQPEYANARSQDLEPLFHDCGQFYWFRTASLIKDKSLMNANTAYFEIPDSEVRDIDTPHDWGIAEALYKCIKSD